MTVYEADWICPVSSPPVRGGCIAVENGRILAAPPANAPGVVRFPGCAIIPGFVNAHSHIELTILRGYLDDLPFGDWIPRLTHAKYKVLSRADLLASARLGAIEMLRAGVTCLGEVMDLGTAWTAMGEFGLQGIAYQEVFGPAESQADDAIAGLREKLDRYRPDEQATLRLGVSPHAPFTVSAKLYRAVDELARRERLPLTTHIGESEDEGLFVRRGAGIFAERWAERGIPVEPPGCSPLAYLAQLGLLRPETLLVHAVDLEDADLQLLRESRPSLVHCPKSNAKLAHGIARLSEMRETGISIGLGTDSVASNNAVDMFEEMRSAVFQQRARTKQFEALNAQAAFRMATLGGAECLGLGDQLGSLDAGKRADFVVIDLSDIALQPVFDPIEAMVYSASRHNVRATYVGGREMKPDVSSILEDVKTAAGKLATKGIARLYRNQTVLAADDADDADGGAS
ncbi:MAG TPA: amidohydrolase family protein [Terriglobia bacterium]|jgi:5-methylthioadenosine/S-adenosylhomocysteine deaminase